ncbi:hypothetical protein B0H16DRAFT_1885130 [Mycena metata]|uniref:ZW10 C-terminal helical domain-containing protein n=1 Tax=Mycena metata TaxID=1033252 RepID=A0AAD7NGS6_9AGAR|nr:hypothetical protein B0H16DRAFT_1885130 [Mycena metata]
MAFPIPAHLPRRQNPQDVSSEILTKIDQATGKTLNASLASSWLAELEDTIRATKTHIHDRIHRDLPQFEQQLETSKSVQTRLQTLVGNVDGLNQTLSDPQTGLIPTLVRSLTAHATLAQQSTDATVRHETLSHLLRCRTEFGSVLSLVQLGKLPQAVGACTEFEQLLRDAPAQLHQTNVMLDLKRKFQAAKSRTEEQLSEAYSRSVTVSPQSLTILPSITVRQSETTLSLSEILSSLSPASLSTHLATLRRDIMTHYVDHLLTQPTTLTPSENGLTPFHAPPNDAALPDGLANVSTALHFLSTHLTSALPAPAQSPFTRALCRPLTTSVLSNLLIPALPNAFAGLPGFIELAQRAVAFEEEVVVRLLGDDGERAIKAWVDGLGGHYERQRRVRILEAARVVVLAPEQADGFRAEIEMVQEKVPVQAEGEEEENADSSWGFEEEGPVNGDAAADDGDGWGFDEDEPEPAPAAVVPAIPLVEESVSAEDGWGFDDEDEPVPDAEPEPQPPAMNGHEQKNGDQPEPEPEPDADDAWGWNDDAPEESAEDTPAWDAWDEPSTSSTDSRPPPAPSIAPAAAAAIASSPAPSPKMATRLEKLANKGKKNLNGSSPMGSPIPSPVSARSSPAPITSAKFPPPKSAPAPPAPAKEKERHPPPPLAPPAPIPKETYLVSARMRQIIVIVEDVLVEGRTFATSNVLPPPPSSTESSGPSPPGTLLLQSAASAVDLYRALYPVKFAARLKAGSGGSEAPMRFSNDCLWLSGEVARLEVAGAGSAPGKGGQQLPPAVKERLGECRHRLKVLGDSWFADTVEHHSQAANDTIVQGAEGFTFTGDQDRYDECEAALSRVVQEIKRLSQRWKGILNKSKYYTAIGMIAEAALARVLQDVLALPDITEVESHRLSELCRIMHALEGLFVEDANQDPFVLAYVPSWLKFQYLSELLEASMVDILDLFDSGSLVDFEVDELVRLVRALFADTALRTNTINRLTGGRA